jgi:hypothetical protein
MELAPERGDARVLSRPDRRLPWERSCRPAGALRSRVDSKRQAKLTAMADQAPSSDPLSLYHCRPQEGARGVREAAGSGQLRGAAGRHHRAEG